MLVKYEFSFHITWITVLNVSKQAMLLDGVDVGTYVGVA